LPKLFPGLLRFAGFNVTPGAGFLEKLGCPRHIALNADTVLVGVTQVIAVPHILAFAPFAVQFRGTYGVGGYPFAELIGVARIGACCFKSDIAFVQPNGELQSVFASYICQKKRKIFYVIGLLKTFYYVDERDSSDTVLL
jgi:hypothetical protein